MPFRSERFDDPAAEASQLLIRLGLAVLAIAVPLAALFFRRSIFLLFPMGAGLVLLGALLAPRKDALARVVGILRTPMGAVAALLIVWAAMSIAWAPGRAEALERLFKVAGTMALAAAAAAVLPDRTRLANLYLSPIGVGAAALVALWLGAMNWLTPNADNPLVDRAMGAVGLLFWPALAVLVARRRVAGALSLAILVALASVVGGAPSAFLSLAAGGLTYAATLSDQTRTTRALGWLFAGMALLGPVLPFAARLLAGGPNAALTGRLAPMGEWLALIRAEPLRLLTGHGLDSAALGLASGALSADAPRTALFDIWYELGVLGAVGAAAMLWGAFRVARRAPPQAAPALAGGLTHGLIVGATGVGTAQIAWLTMIGVAAILFTSMVNGLHKTSRPVAPGSTRPAARAPDAARRDAS
jgi:hypothetical protein